MSFKFANFILQICIVALLTGCKIPRGTVYAYTISGVGVKVGYNPATQMPELYLGYFRTTYHVIPTNSPPIQDSLSVEQHLFSSDIFEEFSYGTTNAPPTNSVAKLRATKKP